MQPKVIILAAGKAERFWPLSDKALFPFLGKSLIEHQIERTRKAGFREVIVVCNRDNLPIIKNFKIKTVLQKGEGQAAAILSAKNFIQGPLLIVNANDLFDPSLFKKVLLVGKGKETEVCLVGYQTTNYFPGGYLVVNKKNEVKKIVEKPSQGKEPSDLVRIVVDFFRQGEKLVNYLQQEILYEKALAEMIKNGEVVKAVSYQKEWGFLKYPWDTLGMMDFFLRTFKKKKIGRNVKISKTAVILGLVMIEDGVKIFENAKIVGPAYIGQGTIIGNNTLIRESMIGRNCVVGFSTEITRSYLGDDCWLHSNYLGDSVLDKNVSLGAGAVLANLRLDEGNIYSCVKGEKIHTRRTKLGVIVGQNVRIGVNTSMMPGIKIGENSFIGAGVVLDKDLGEGKFCGFKKKSLTIRRNRSRIKRGEREEFKKELTVLR